MDDGKGIPRLLVKVGIDRTGGFSIRKEHDQALRPTLVVSQREGSAWSTNPTWGPRSSTFRTSVVVRPAAKPTIGEAGVVNAQVLQLAPSELRNGLSGPPWVQLRLSK